jgi:pimeloyl-ACP methyl ester carboxylesterase
VRGRRERRPHAGGVGRRVLVSGTAVALAAGLLLLGGPPTGGSAGVPTANGAGRAQVAHIDVDQLAHCPGQLSRLRCGKLALPFEREDPSLGTIPIAFAVRPRGNTRRPSKGVIVAIEGGPGYGSIPSAAGYIDTFAGLLRRRELLLVDARGTGSSQPIDCPELQRGLADNAIGVAACAHQLGPRFDSYRTAAAADDINDVRAALGFDRVLMYGDSYGTLLAQSYAFRHGDTLRALVLDGAFPVMGEDPWYPSTWRTGIRGLAVACRRAPSCRGSTSLRLRRFVAQLRHRRLGVGPLLDAIAGAGYAPPGSYLRIDRAILAFLTGHEGPYRRLTRRRTVAFGRPSSYSAGQEQTISCNDYPMIWDKASSWEERRRQLATAIRRYPAAAFAPFTPAEIALTPDSSYRQCLGAPRPGPRYQPPAAASDPAPAAPVLVISGELDNVTAPAEGRAAAQLFPHATFVLWRNAGHVQSLYDPASRGAVRIRRFLRHHGR